MIQAQWRGRTGRQRAAQARAERMAQWESEAERLAATQIQAIHSFTYSPLARYIGETSNT